MVLTLCYHKFKKDKQAAVIHTEKNLLKRTLRFDKMPKLNVMADILKKAKEEKDCALRQKAKLIGLQWEIKTQSSSTSLSSVDFNQTPLMCST